MFECVKSWYIRGTRATLKAFYHRYRINAYAQIWKSLFACYRISRSEACSFYMHVCKLRILYGHRFVRCMQSIGIIALNRATVRVKHITVGKISVINWFKALLMVIFHSSNIISTIKFHTAALFAGNFSCRQVTLYLYLLMFSFLFRILCCVLFFLSSCVILFHYISQKLQGTNLILHYSINHSSYSYSLPNKLIVYWNISIPTKARIREKRKNHKWNKWTNSLSPIQHQYNTYWHSKFVIIVLKISSTYDTD